MAGNFIITGISPTFKPSKRSESVIPITEDLVTSNVKPLSFEPFESYTKISLSLPDSSRNNPSTSLYSMPEMRMVDIKGSVPKRTKTSTQCTRQHALLRPKCKILKTKIPIVYLTHTKTLIDIVLIFVCYKTLANTNGRLNQSAFMRP